MKLTSKTKIALVSKVKRERYSVDLFILAKTPVTKPELRQDNKSTKPIRRSFSLYSIVKVQVEIPCLKETFTAEGCGVHCRISTGRMPVRLGCPSHQ